MVVNGAWLQKRSHNDELQQRSHPRRQDGAGDIVVLKLLRELDVMGYEIVKKPGNAGFTFETPGGDGSV
jgi:hypothetical protein